MTDPGRSFEERFASLHGVAYRVAYAVVGERAEAEDIAQESLARALADWRRVCAFAEPWVVRVSGNLALDRVRALQRRSKRVTTSPVAEVHSDRIDLVRALGRLSQRQREVVVMRFIGGFTEAEVAAALGCSEGSVKQHSSRGLAALRLIVTEGAEDVRAPVRP